MHRNSEKEIFIIDYKKTKIKNRKQNNTTQHNTYITKQQNKLNYKTYCENYDRHTNLQQKS